MTPEVRKQICKYISEGLPRTHAAALAGISRDTFYDHQARFPDFSDAVKRADAKFVRTHVQRIKQAGRKEWTASAWLLERTHPEEFGRVDQHVIAAARRGQQPTGKLSDEFMQAVRAALGVTGKLVPIDAEGNPLPTKASSVRFLDKPKPRYTPLLGSDDGRGDVIDAEVLDILPQD